MALVPVDFMLEGNLEIPVIVQTGQTIGEWRMDLSVVD